MLELDVELEQVAAPRPGIGLPVGCAAAQEESVDAVRLAPLVKRLEQLRQALLPLAGQPVVGAGRLHEVLGENREARPADEQRRRAGAADGLRDFEVARQEVPLAQRVDAVDVAQRDPHHVGPLAADELLELRDAPQVAVEEQHLVVGHPPPQVALQIGEPQRVDRIGLPMAVGRDEQDAALRCHFQKS